MKLMIKHWVRMGLMAVMLAGAGAAEMDLAKPVPRIRLADGRILQDVKFVSFKPLDVVIRHRAGPMAIRYEALPDDIRAAAEQQRPGGPKWFPGETAQNSITVEGQVFVQTVGAGAYKFGEAKVYAFAAEHLTAWERVGRGQVVQLPKPLAVATTDGDGKFRLTMPKDTPYFIFCQATRLLVAGSTSYTELNEWRVPGEQFKNPKEAFLTGKNAVAQPSKVAIEEQT